MHVHYNTIFFDLDGTLVDSLKAIVFSVNAVLSELGLPEKTIDEVRPFIGLGVRDLIRNTIPTATDEEMQFVIDTYEKVFREQADALTVLYPGVFDTLSALQNRQLGVVTNRSAAAARRTLKRTGLLPFLRTIVGGDDPNCMKPSACPIKQGLLSMTVYERNGTLIVGDMPVDIQAGKAAGIVTCGVTYGIGKKEDLLLAKPDYLIGSITELFSIIN